MINAAVRNSIRGSGRQAYPHQVARALPRAGLLLYLGRPNLEAADVPIGDDMFLLPADTTIRTATGWVSGTVNLFYDADGVPIAVFASEIVAWASINQWNVLFHLVSADTETGRLAIYEVDTPLVTLNKALRVLREDQIDLTPTTYFNGVFTTSQITAAGGTYTGGPTVFADNLGVLRSPGANLPAIEGMRLATTLADGAVLGAEVWPTTGAFNFESATVTADANLIYYTESPTNVSAYKFLTGIVTRTNYRCKFEIVSIDKGALYFDPGASATTVFATAGVHEVDLLWGANTWAAIRTVGVTTATVRIISLSVRQIVPTYYDTTLDGTPLLPSVHQPTRTFDAGFTTSVPGPTYKKYARANPAVDLPGYLCEPARTNKCTCRKANPVDLTNVNKGGDAASVLSVVDDTAALTAAGLIGVCNSGKVYKLDNSLGTIAAYAFLLGAVGNLNAHSVSAHIRCGVGSGSLSIDNSPSQAFSGAVYSKVTNLNRTPDHISRTLIIAVLAGSVVYFILPQLEEGAFATSPICKLADGSDPLTAITRQGTVLSFPTSGKIRNNDVALKLSAIPRGAGQSGYLWGSYTDASNFTYLSIGPYDITFKSVVNGFSQDLAIASYTHKAGTPFEVILCKSSKGAQLLVREYSGGTWQPWVRGGFSVASDNLVVGSAYTLGAFNNAGQFAGNISEIDSLLIPAGIANPVAWVESQWGVTGAGSNPVIFNHTFTGLTLLDGVLSTKSASDSVTINWGDGTSNTYSGTADTAFTHTYASATTVYNVTYTASDNSVLTKIFYTDRAGGKVGGALSLPAAMTTFACYGFNTLSGVLSLPAGMTTFTCYGSNTLSGALSLPAGMTTFTCYGSNTLSGALSLPAGMTSFTCCGSNTLSGVLSLPAGMTYFVCYGSNTLSGVLSLPAGMTYFGCGGSNTLSGVLSLPAAMTSFTCTGYNTLSGVLSMPVGMTYFYCAGSNTLSGVLSLPAGMTSFTCAGSNTLSGYTPSTKASNQNRFTLTGLNTLSAANVDAIIQDYAAAGGTWTGEKVFSLTVLTASNRTAASDAAWATLGTKGLVTRTITLR